MKKSTTKHRTRGASSSTKVKKIHTVSTAVGESSCAGSGFCRVFKVCAESVFARVCHPSGMVSDHKSEPLVFPKKCLVTVFIGDVLRYSGPQAKLSLEHVARTRRYCQVHIQEVSSNAAYVMGKIEERGSDLLVYLLPEAELVAGNACYAEILCYPTTQMPAILTFEAPVTESIADAPFEERLACDQGGFSLGFSGEILRDTARHLAQYPEGEESYDEAYQDLTDLGFVTIDGESSKDFDDAVYAEPTAKGEYRLFVAVADVSRYVQEDSLLDKEAACRGNSVYLPVLTLPMLPEVLSNDLCSLKPYEDRYVLVCEMLVGTRGVKSHQFYPAIICSQARLTYDQAYQCLEERDTDHPAYEDLSTLYEVFTLLRKQRARRGAIDFDLPELKVDYHADGRFLGLKALFRHDMHRLIEECMLAANVCAAQVIEAHTASLSLYRVHEVPDIEKIDLMRKVLGMHGVVVPKAFGGTVGDYAVLLESMTEYRELQLFVLRSLKQAAYTADNVGHFGLNYTHYTHFTSPIRRYADLLVHRMIKHIVCGRPLVHYTPRAWRELLAHISLTERIAEDVSRSLLSWYKCLYMHTRIGSVFSGRITSVTHFGIFVAIEDMGIEGVVHISRLGQDYFYFDPKKMILCGRRYHKIYRIGDVLSVVVAQVNLRVRRIDLTLVDSSADAYEKR